MVIMEKNHDHVMVIIVSYLPGSVSQSECVKKSVFNKNMGNMMTYDHTKTMACVIENMVILP